VRAIPQKIHILKFVGEQGIVTIPDVARHLFQSDKLSYVRVTMHELGIAHMKYRDIPNGIWYIDNPKLFELLKSYFPQLPPFEVRPVTLHYVDHSLELNRIRTAFTKSNLISIDEWWSEDYIRALPNFDFGNIKTPDAIFWRKRQDGTRQKVFLEYERTLKNKDRYKDIFRNYSKHKDVKNRNVIYLCQTSTIREELLEVENKLAAIGKLEGAGLYFQFVTLENFYKTYDNQTTTKEILPCVPSKSVLQAQVLNAS
jgi:hypothetical protein